MSIGGVDRVTEAELRELAAQALPSWPMPVRSNCWSGPTSISAVNTSWPPTCRTRCWSTWPPRCAPGVDVLFLDTGYHFAETIGTRDAVEAVYDIHVVNVTPERTVAEQDQLLGKDLFASNPTECCRVRKVEPLSKALRGYTAWVTGIRRVEAPTRANAPADQLRRRLQAGEDQPAGRVER